MISKQAWRWLDGTNIVQALENRWVFDTPWYGASHFWSLAIEEQFYLVWPFAVLFVPERALLRVCAGLVLVSLWLRIVLVANGVASLPIYVLLPTRFDTLAAGATVAVVLRDPEARRRVAPVARAVALGGLIVIAAIFIARRGRFAVSDPLIATVGLSVIALTFAALIAYVVSAGSSSRITAALENQVLRSFGHYSYGAYVVHWLILPPLASMAGPSTLSRALPATIADIVFVGIALVLTASLAVALRHLWEERFLRLKRYF